jgi:uncharacterized protein (DUF342 family)
MTKLEAIELENKCDELVSEAIGEKVSVSMALTGRLKINFANDYFSLSEDLTKATYVNYHGYYSDLQDYINKACDCISSNKELFDKLIWSYKNELN